MKLRITRKEVEALDIESFDLVDPSGGPLPAFTAGAHVDVEIRPGLVRQYSLYNAPSERAAYSIAVLREPASRGGSEAMHALTAGESLTISEPKNHFSLLPARRTLLFAGGIGVTPIMSMSEHLNEQGSDFALHYSARTTSRAAFLAKLERGPFADRVHVHLDEMSAGSTRAPLDLDAVLGAEDRDAHLYVCGPSGYIDFVLAGARKAGWPESALHVERFVNTPSNSDDDETFKVQLATSGTTYTVDPGKSIAQVLMDHGVEFPISCEQGVCGTCLTGVISGEIVHRDVFLDDNERARNDRIALCCSRGRGLLILDM